MKTDLIRTFYEYNTWANDAHPDDDGGTDERAIRRAGERQFLLGARYARAYDVGAVELAPALARRTEPAAFRARRVCRCRGGAGALG